MVLASRDGLGIAIEWLGLYKDTTVPTCMTSRDRSSVVKFSFTEQYLEHRTQIAPLIIQYLQAPQTLRQSNPEPPRVVPTSRWFRNHTTIGRSSN